MAVVKTLRFWLKLAMALSQVQQELEYPHEDPHSTFIGARVCAITRVNVGCPFGDFGIFEHIQEM